MIYISDIYKEEVRALRAQLTSLLPDSLLVEDADDEVAMAHIDLEAASSSPPSEVRARRTTETGGKKGARNWDAGEEGGRQEIGSRVTRRRIEENTGGNGSAAVGVLEEWRRRTESASSSLGAAPEEEHGDDHRALAAHHDQEEHHDAAAHHSHAHEALFFLFNAIVIGTILMQLTTLPMFHGLQQTVVLFVLGAIYSIAMKLSGAAESEESGPMGRSYLHIKCSGV